MNKKLQCIKNLKSKLFEMQKQLERIQKKPCITEERQQRSSQQKSWFHKTVNLSNYNSAHSPVALTKNTSWKNPNFWGSNPITGKENYVISPSKWSKEKSLSKQKSINNQQKAHQVQQDNFLRKYSTSYKNLSPRPVCQQKLDKYCTVKQSQLKPQKYMYSFHGNQRDTPRFQKIKTYQQPLRNPILNPQKQQQKGIRIVKKPSFSPSTNLIQNPKSNPNVYCYGQKLTVLSPKHNNIKNVSPNIKQILSSSLQQKVRSPKKKSCKKHFARYFKDNFESKWD